MPITPTAITQSILLAQPQLVGPDWVALATSVGIAVSSWCLIPANVVLSGVCTGTKGTGVVLGKYNQIPQVISLASNITSAGFYGLDVSKISIGVGLGVGNALNASAGYKGVATGVGSGADTSKVIIANPATLIGLLTGSMASVGLVGPSAALLAVGIGNGIASMVLQGGSGIGSIIGTVTPLAGQGVSRSSLI